VTHLVPHVSERSASLNKEARWISILRNVLASYSAFSQNWRVSGNILWLSHNRLVLSGARRGAAALHSVDLDGNEKSLYPTAIAFDLHDCSATGRTLASCVDSRLHVAFRTPSMETERHMYPLVNTRLVGLTPDARYAVLMNLLGDA